MKKYISLTLTIGLLLIVAVAPARAQSCIRLKAHIPFQFVVGGKTFPAGEYFVERIKRETIIQTLQIRPVNGGSGVFILASPAEVIGKAGMAKLIFHCYGDTRFLSLLQIDGKAMGLQLPKSSAERRLEREMRERSRDGVAEHRTLAIVLGR